jgi:hypothetical protein
LSCLRTYMYVSILYCCNCWYNYECTCIFVIAPWGTLIGITYIVLYCIVWYINNWHINFNLSSKYSIWTTVMCKYGFKCHMSFCVHLSGKYGIWTTVICPLVYTIVCHMRFLCTFTVKRIERFSWTRGSQEPESLNHAL